MTEYTTILADPPWEYDHAGSAMGVNIRPGKHYAGVNEQYPTMTVEQIAALPVKKLATANAHLYLWVTAPLLLDVDKSLVAPASRVMREWGFTYKTTITWVKTYEAAGQMSLFGGELPELRPRNGLGYYFNGATEFLLFGVRGSLKTLVDNQVNVIYAPVGRHSEKPEESYRLIKRCSPGPRLELFARKKRPGWDVWGNEVEPDIELPGAIVGR